MAASTFSFEQLEHRYGGFYAPTAVVKINGRDLFRHGIGITDVVVETSSEMQSDSCSFTIVNAFDLVTREFRWLDDYFTLGTHVKVLMGYQDKVKEVFYGPISNVSVDFPTEGAPVLRIRCMDFTMTMMNGSESRRWVKKSYSDVIHEVIRRYPLQGHVDRTSEKIESITQENESDYQFLIGIAKKLNYEFQVVGRKLYFRKKRHYRRPVLTLTWGKNLRHFAVQGNLPTQVSQVVVRGWDQKQAKPIVGKASHIPRLGGNSLTGPDLLRKMGAASNGIQYVEANVASVQEANERAAAILEDRAMRLVQGEAETIGLPEILPGRYIKLDGLGKKFNQPYRISAATHTVNESGYIVRFQVEGNAL